MRFKLMEAFGDQTIQIKIPVLTTIEDDADDNYKSTIAYQQSLNICITNIQVKILMDIYKNLSYLKDILNVSQFDFSYQEFDNPHLIFTILTDKKINEEDLLKGIRRYLDVEVQNNNPDSNITMSVNTLTEYIKVNFN